MGPIVIAFEGNIGVGKSTFLSYMKSNVSHLHGRKIIYIEEPVQLWQNLEGVDMLAQFYQDQEKHAFEFQMLATITRIKLLQESIQQNKNAVFIVERCYLSDNHIFTKMLFEQKKISPQQYAIIQMWFSYIQIKIDYVVYLRANPTICHERCLRRNRSGETVSLEYIEACHAIHESWMSTIPNKIVLNCNYTSSTSVYESHIETILVKVDLFPITLMWMYLGFMWFYIIFWNLC
jgi:deoxyadenosine/deoxycytidine kinase